MNIFHIIKANFKLIETKNLRIYPLEINSNTLNTLFKIYSDSENVKNYCNPINDWSYFKDMIDDKIEYHQNEINGFISFAIENKFTSEIIGVRNIILDGIYTKNGISIETASKENIITEILINKKYWRHGLGYEASNAIFETLKTFGINQILSFIKTNNDPAIFLDLKLGFKATNYINLLERNRFHKDCTIHTNDYINSIMFLRILE